MYDPRLPRPVARRAANLPRTSAALPIAIMAIVAVCTPAHAQDSTVEPSSKGQTNAAPKLVAIEDRIDLGIVIEGDVVEVAWVIENQGNADLHITRTRAGCGCTLLETPTAHRIIPPGGQHTVRAKFNSQGRPGKQTKVVTVESDDRTNPKTKLAFAADVVRLFDIKPLGAVNLQMVQRGATPSKSLEVHPAQGRGDVEILDLALASDEPITYRVEPMSDDHPGAKRIVFTVKPGAPMGRIDARANLRVRIDGIERERSVTVRGIIVADLIWIPKVVNVTRFPSVRGQQLVPVSLRATEDAPFDVIKATVGDALDVVVEPDPSAKPRTKYLCKMTIREDAPPGPFATNLTVWTTSLDLPIIEVPVFGNVARRVKVEPALIVLRQDGTDVGTMRQVKLQAAPQATLELTSATCANKAVTAFLDTKASASYQHIRYLQVRLVDELPPGVYEATLTITTNISGAESIKVPVRIEIPTDAPKKPHP